jgi:hypothetical protein
MNKIFSRRQILAQLAAAPILSAIGYEAYALPSSSNDGLTEICLFAWNESKTAGRTIDLWTARCGSIDVLRLSDQLGRFIVWDDIISDHDEGRSIGAIKSAISRWFGILPIMNGTNSATHLGDVRGVPRTLGCALARFRNDETPLTDRIAIVDLDSCGVTRLQWRDLIPCLKEVYGTVVGLDYSDPYFNEFDPAYYSAPYLMSEDSWRTLMACDYWAVASDNSLSRQKDLCAEARVTLFTEALNDLSAMILQADNVEGGFVLGARKHFLGYGPSL